MEKINIDKDNEESEEIKNVISSALNSLKEIQKNRAKVQTEIVNIFERENLEISVAYQILEDLVLTFRKLHPELVLAERFSNETMKHITPEQLKRFDEFIDKKLREEK